MQKNQKKKLCVAIIFGGRSAEHEVSINSARNVFKSLNKEKYDFFLAGINREGVWFSFDQKEFLEGKPLFDNKVIKRKHPLSFLPMKDSFFVIDGKKKTKVDVVFPVLHGPFGEDGTMQGFLKLFGVPFVGPGVLGSAVGMDKDVAKRLLVEAGIPVAPFLVFEKNQQKEIYFESIKKTLGLPFFIKPANLGSSVGISKVKSKNEFKKALECAFSYDYKIVIEEAIVGREIECSVLGNENPVASTLGEITPNHDFYSYKAKYLDDKGADLIVGTKLPKSIEKKVQEMALKTFAVLCCEGMSRVDFFLTKDNQLFINEINTIPGFTKISMYPKLLEKSGISQNKLIDNLLYLAIDRFKKEKKLKTV